MSLTVKQILAQDISKNAFMQINTLRDYKIPIDELAAEIVNLASMIFGKDCPTSENIMSVKQKLIESQLINVCVDNEICPECFENGFIAEDGCKWCDYEIK